MGDFEVIIFSQTSGVRNFFPPHIAVSDFFSALYVTDKEYFFQRRILFFPGISSHTFFLSKSVCRIFFL